MSDQEELFPNEETASKAPRKRLILEEIRSPTLPIAMAPAQTNAKSKLIAEYITNFQIITKGGVYIDGFAAPQSREHEDAWTARRVLEVAPPRLRTFWLCDIDPKGITQLRSLKAQHHKSPSWRRVIVLQGDFNSLLEGILRSGRIKRGTPVFALLDQRHMECHWATVRALAAYKGRTKVELLYFVGTAWLQRSIKTAHKPERLAQISRWWGGEEWRSLAEMNQVEAIGHIADRFENELHYPHVHAYQIFLKEQGKKVAFHLIHASDHPEAPKLMHRAYRKIIGDVERSPVDSQKRLFD